MIIDAVSVKCVVLFIPPRSGGFVDRSYPNMLVVSFGVRDADCSADVGFATSTSKGDSESIITCCQVAMKLSLLADRFKKEMLAYEVKRQERDHQGSVLTLSLIHI